MIIRVLRGGLGPIYVEPTVIGYGLTKMSCLVDWVHLQIPFNFHLIYRSDKKHSVTKTLCDDTMMITMLMSLVKMAESVIEHGTGSNYCIILIRQLKPNVNMFRL